MKMPFITILFISIQFNTYHADKPLKVALDMLHIGSLAKHIENIAHTISEDNERIRLMRKEDQNWKGIHLRGAA